MIVEIYKIENGKEVVTYIIDNTVEVKRDFSSTKWETVITLISHNLTKREIKLHGCYYIRAVN